MTSGIGVTLLWWGNPHSQYQSHGVTRVYRNIVDDFYSATEIGSPAGISYVDRAVEDNTTYYYWIRWESDDGQLGPAVDGHGTETAVDPAKEIARLTQEILNDPLTKELLSPVEPIRLVDPALPQVSVPSPEVELLIGTPVLDAKHAPVVEAGSTLHVGADAVPGNTLRSAASHGGIQIFHGTVADGVGANELTAYLRADAVSYRHTNYSHGLTPRFGAIAPTVHVVQGATAEMIGEAARAVQIINAALPDGWQLKFSPVADSSGSLKPSSGKIVIEFAARENWPSTGSPPAFGVVGSAAWWPEVRTEGTATWPPVFQISTAHAWVDHTRVSGELRMKVLVHEIIHALGRYHPDAARFPGSIMNNPISSYGVPGHILHPLDSEALLAVHGRVEASTPPDSIFSELGPWSSASMHIKGNIPGMDAAFGVALRNGLARPWAYGPVPDSFLADNSALSGTVSWTGRLLGLTPARESVGGAADLSVILETLNGWIDFTGLESWLVNMAPGAVGTGITWGDAALRYTIGVSGNTFVETGGDEGTVTGAFFGPSHEGMGGVLERYDLNATFGGKR